jgi:hypothetical protein
MSEGTSTTTNGFSSAGTGRLDPAMTAGRAKEIYEQLLALADRMGAAYVDAYQKITVGIGGEQDRLARSDRSNWLREVPASLAKSASADPLGSAAQRAVQLTDSLLEMSTKIGLAYVDAHEQAALAAADCREALAAGSHNSLVKTIASARAELIREIARTCASTAREIVVD